MKNLFLVIALISFTNIYSQDTLYFNTMESGDSICDCKAEVIVDKTDSTEILFEFNINDSIFHVVCESKDSTTYKAEENDLSINTINVSMGKMGPFITVTYDTKRSDMWLYNSKKWFK